ncbi:MAG: hypothetical protein ABIF77_22300 [bacterium]
MFADLLFHSLRIFRVGAILLFLLPTLVWSAGFDDDFPASPRAAKAPPGIDWSRNILYLILDGELELYSEQVLLDLDGPITTADNYRFVSHLLQQARGRIDRAPSDRTGAIETLLVIHELLSESGFSYRDYSSWEYRLLGFGLLNHGLARREIDCAMYVYLYLGIAEHLGLPLVGLDLPEHITLRWRLPDGFYFNWEATLPAVRDDDFYRDWKQFSPQTISSGVYLRPLAKPEILASAFYAKSLVFFERGELTRATTAVDRTLALYPRHPDAHNLKGLLLDQEGDFLGALCQFDRAIDLDAGFAQAYFNRAKTRLTLGETEAVGLDLSELQRLDPDLGNVLRHLQRQD